MNVYVVFHNVDYEGSDILKIFEDKPMALQFIEKEVEKKKREIEPLRFRVLSIKGVEKDWLIKGVMK